MAVKETRDPIGLRPAGLLGLQRASLEEVQSHKEPYARALETLDRAIGYYGRILGTQIPMPKIIFDRGLGPGGISGIFNTDRPDELSLDSGFIKSNTLIVYHESGHYVRDLLVRDRSYQYEERLYIIEEACGVAAEALGAALEGGGGWAMALSHLRNAYSRRIDSFDVAEMIIEEFAKQMALREAHGEYGRMHYTERSCLELANIHVANGLIESYSQMTDERAKHITSSGLAIIEIVRKELNLDEVLREILTSRLDAISEGISHSLSQDHEEKMRCRLMELKTFYL